MTDEVTQQPPVDGDDAISLPSISQGHNTDFENAENGYEDAESERGQQQLEDGQRWKEYSQNVSKNVVLEKLRDATKKRQEKRLAEALHECDLAGIEENEDVDKAKYVLGVIQAQQELAALYIEDDPTRLKEEFEAIRKRYANYHDDTLWEQSQVRQRLWWLQKGYKYREVYNQQVFNLSPSVISEIRRYTQPTKVVHSIVQAALLLFGENENQTKVWSYCQKCLNPQGSSSLVSRLIDFEVKEVHSEIAARAEELLNLLVQNLQTAGGSEETIKTSSPSAFTLYVWTQGMLDQRRQLASDNGEPWKPARLKPAPSRQLKIFEEQHKALLLKQRQEAQQQKEAAAANSPRSRSPKRNTLNAGKPSNPNRNGPATSRKIYGLSDD